MLVPIGSRARPDDLAGALLDCHDRIRRFLGLAAEVARRADLPAAEVVDACARCERYFVEALPRHVEDEEVTIRPRLRGAAPEVDAALDAMHAEHGDHEPLLAGFLDAIRAVRDAPADAAARARLAAATAPLGAELDRHLAAEEAVVFPAVRALPADVQGEMLGELRARRTR